MSRTGSLAVAVLLAVGGSVAAQGKRPTVADLDVADRMRADFYHAIAVGAKGVSVEWTATPEAVPLDGELTLTLTVRNAANPPELVKPPLGDLPAFAERFQVLDRPDPAPAADAAEVRFTWTLRPRSPDVKEVPQLTYVYSKDRQFRTTYARAKPITVSPPAPKENATTPPVPLDGPEEFFATAEDARRLPSPPPIAWLLPVAAVPVLVAGWVLLWRWKFPDAARLAKLGRNRAARLALNRLKTARTAADPAGAAVAAVRDYLAVRFAVPPYAQTPTEVANALRAGGFPEQACDAEAWLRECDAARYARVRDHELSIVAQGEGLIAAWEEAAG